MFWAPSDPHMQGQLFMQIFELKFFRAWPYFLWNKVYVFSPCDSLNTTDTNKETFGMYGLKTARSTFYSSLGGYAIASSHEQGCSALELDQCSKSKTHAEIVQLAT